MRAWTHRVLCGVSLVLVASLAWAAEPDDPKTSDEFKKLLEKVRQDEKVKQRYNELLAGHYYKTARKRFNERRYQEAADNLENALAVAPQHKEAKELLVITRRILGQDDRGQRNLISRERLVRRVKIRYALADMLKTIEEAKERLNENDFAPALDKLDAARNSAKVLARHLDVSRETAQINALTDRAVAGRKQAQEQSERRQREAAKTLAEKEHARLADLHTQRVERLFDDAKQLFQDTRYLLAAKKADEILKVDPRNQEVIAFRESCQTQQIEADLAWYDKKQTDETAETWRRVRKLSIPFSDVQPLYPDDWDEKRKRTAGISIESESPEDQAWQKKLNAVLEEPVSFDFIATPLDDVVAFLRNLKKCNIVIDRGAVQDRGNLDVTLRLDKVKFKDALEWVLRLLNLSYTLENGAIYVSTKEKIGASQKTVTRFYDVTDLTVEIRNFKPNVRAISNADLDDEDMDDIFAEDDDDDDAEPDTFTGESLVEFIKSVIAPGSWDEVGGAGGGGIDL